MVSYQGWSWVPRPYLLITNENGPHLMNRPYFAGFFFHVVVANLGSGATNMGISPPENHLFFQHQKKRDRAVKEDTLAIIMVQVLEITMKTNHCKRFSA